MPTVRWPSLRRSIYRPHLCHCLVPSNMRGWVPCACTMETSVDNIWIAEGWSAFVIAMLILKTYAILLYLLVRSEFGVPE